MNRTEEAVKLAKIVSFLEKNRIKNATINKVNNDFIIDVKGDVDLYRKNLTEIPFQFGRVDGSFDCNDNNLTSLKGCPKYVGGVFNCSYNEIENLEGCSECENIICSHNKDLTSLVGSPKHVRNLDCSYCDINPSLVGAPEYVGGVFDCTCLSGFCTSLDGIPKEIGTLNLTDTFVAHEAVYNGAGVIDSKIKYIIYLFVWKGEDYEDYDAAELKNNYRDILKDIKKLFPNSKIITSKKDPDYANASVMKWV